MSTTTTTRPDLVAQLPTKAKPSKVVSRDQARPLLAQGYLTKGRKGFELHVCDSYIAARIPVDVRKAKGDRRRPPLNPGFVPPEALKAIEQDEFRQFTARNGTVDVGSVAFKRPDERRTGKYPDLNKLFPAKRPRKPLVLGLNTKMLRSLAEGLGSDVVTIELDLALVKGGKYLKPFHVRPIDGGEGDGLLMPVNVHVAETAERAKKQVQARKAAR